MVSEHRRHIDTEEEPPMLSTIIVPLDGSEFAGRALPQAQTLARSSTARLILARVLPLLGPGSSCKAMEAARAVLSLDVEALRADGLAADGIVRRAVPIHPDYAMRAV